MWVLAIDTATPLPGIALTGESGERQEALPTGRQASEALLPGLAALLAAARLEFTGVDRLAVCSGPGSFTGIRVGLATAWGLSRALSIPIETFGSLEAIAELGRNAELGREAGAARVAAAFDAERGEVYFASFDLEGPRARAISPPALIARRSAAGACPPGTPLIFVEPGAGGTLPALAAARAIRRSPGETTAAPVAAYVRMSAAEEFRGVSAS